MTKWTRLSADFNMCERASWCNKMEAIIGGLQLLLRVEVLIYMIVGIVIGMILGALPGLGAMIGMSVLLPLTFSMDPVSAIVLLVCVFKGTTMGGAFTAILINVPGTPAAAAVTIEGYRLTQKGLSKKALHASILSASTGDFISDIILLVGAVSLAIVALKLGPAEIFWIVLFALILTAIFSGKSFWKGLLAMSFGLLLGHVGTDPMTSVQRLAIVPSLRLLKELDIVPVMLGIFAFSEIMLRMEESWRNKAGQKSELRSILGPGLTLADVKDSIKAFFIGTGIGTVFGMVPGLGSIAAAFSSYEITKNAYNGKSKSGKFGEGAIPGVVGPESANAAVSGANFLPVLVLGIPGSPTAALLLSCLMLQGFTVGPRMFVEQAPMLYAFFFAFLIANFFNFAFAHLLLKPISAMLRANPKIVFPVAMMLCFVGVYSLNYRIVDLGVMIVIGVIGYFMKKADIPTTPCAVAFVLASKAEQTFRQAVAIGDYPYLIQSIVSKIVILLTVAVIVWGVLQRRKSAKLRKDA